MVPALEGAGRYGRALAATAWAAVALLPLVGLASLLLRRRLDPHWGDHRVHFIVFLTVGAFDVTLATAAGQAARKRGDARVLLIALAFLSTGGFLALHALGTPMVLFSDDLSGFKVAVPFGLVLGALFAVASAFAEERPALASWAIRRQRRLQGAVLGAVAAWAAWTLVQAWPLDGVGTEGATGALLTVLAVTGCALYAAAALRYASVYRADPGLLTAAIIACFLLLAEAMIGVALTGERAWHASWWEWHGLLVVAYLVVGFAARREWSEERFRKLYLPTTRERSLEISVLFCDLAGFTTFTERADARDVAAMLKAYYEIAAPAISRAGGTIEHFTGDGVMSTFNAQGTTPDHALRAARAALRIQEAMASLAEREPDWPRVRVGVNTGEAIVREMGGHGHVAYSVVGDSVNVGARLEGLAPVGGVLIGAETYRRLPDGAQVEPRPGLRVKGKDAPVDAYVLRALRPPRG